MNAELRCLACGVRVYTLSPAPPPKFYICGHCAKTLTKDEIIELADARDISTSSEGKKSQGGGT